MEPELIADYACVIGEGPLWHPQERRLYWIDIARGHIYRYQPASGVHEQVYEGDSVGGFTIQADGALLLFMERGAVKTWRDGALTTLIEEIPAERDSRFNDVIADPVGRVFCGTIATADHQGRLYRLDPDCSLTEVQGDVGTSNGLGFTPDRTRMYYTDSPKYEIYLFDYDVASGSISNRRVFARLAESEGLPDGLTVDADGYVWSARWDGECVVRYAPDGREERRVSMPVKIASSITFGGDDYADLYITSGGGDRKHEKGAAAGGLFRVRPGVRGVPEFFSRIGL